MAKLSGFKGVSFELPLLVGWYFMPPKSLINRKNIHIKGVIEKKGKVCWSIALDPSLRGSIYKKTRTFLGLPVVSVFLSLHCSALCGASPDAISAVPRLLSSSDASAAVAAFVSCDLQSSA